MNFDNKVYCMLAHGKSLEVLDQRIEEFRQFNDKIVYCGLNFFNPSEKILNKIGRDFDIVFDCATVADEENYEINIRIPRLTEFLLRSNNKKYITIKGNLCDLRNRLFRNGKLKENFNVKFDNKIIYADSFFPQYHMFSVSLPLFIAILHKMGYSKIILFGADGVPDNIEGRKGVSSYYNPDSVQIERQVSGIKEFDLRVDTNRINNYYLSTMTEIFGSNNLPTVINCTSIVNERYLSYYEVFEKKSYDQTVEWLRLQ